MKLSAPDIAYVRQYVRENSAIVLDGKDYLIETRLETLALGEGLRSLIHLMDALHEENRPGELHRKMVDALTTNETYFFRDVHPFEAIRKAILPELIARKRAHRTLRIWSAACSSGQEPLTLAMLAAAHFPELADWRIQILATDLSDAMLARARAGLYSQLEVNRGLPAAMLMRFFEERGCDWQARPELLANIRYERLNLIGDWPPRGPFDLILVRNVLIYFEVEVKRAILKKMAELLAPGGYLILGAAETAAGLIDGLELSSIDKTAVCRRKI